MRRFKKSEIDEWLAGSLFPGPLNILVIENEKPLCDFLVKMLAPEGRTVHAAHSGEDALSVLSAAELDLVYLDLVLPGLSEIEICQKICNLSYPPEAIGITPFVASHLLISVLEAGLLTIIQKPFQLDTILEAVKKRIAMKLEYLNLVEF